MCWQPVPRTIPLHHVSVRVCSVAFGAISFSYTRKGRSVYWFFAKVQCTQPLVGFEPTTTTQHRAALYPTELQRHIYRKDILLYANRMKNIKGFELFCTALRTSHPQADISENLPYMVLAPCTSGHLQKQILVKKIFEAERR